MVKVEVIPGMKNHEFEDKSVWVVSVGRKTIFIERGNFKGFPPRKISGFGNFDSEFLTFFGIKLPSNIRDGDFFSASEVTVPKSWYQLPKTQPKREETKFVKGQQFKVQPRSWRQEKKQPQVSRLSETGAVVDSFVPQVEEFPALC